MAQRWFVFVGLLAVGLAGRVSPGQGRQINAGDLHLHDIGGRVYLETQYRQETEQRSGITVEETDLFMEQRAELSTRGYYFHPNLLDFSADLRLGFTQQRLSVSDRDFDSDGTLLGYNLNAAILRRKPVSGRIFARMSDRYISRAFARAVQLDRHTEGGELRLRNPIPITVLFQHTAREEASSIRVEDEKTYLVRATVTDNRNINRLTELVYEYETTEETSSFFAPDGSISFTQDLPDERHEVNVVNRWQFGDEQMPHRLTGRLRAMQRTGFFENDVLLFDQRLDLAHSTTFSTFYGATFLLDETDTQEERLAQGQVGFVKQFFESLQLRGQLFGADRQFENGQEQRFGALLDADYRKLTPWGVYSSRLTLGREYQNEAFAGGLRNVRDEGVNLSSLTFANLDLPNVLVPTVTVTDATNTTTFVEGFDYELQNIGNFTQIRRLVGGGIAEGQLVLVDYQADVATDAEFHTDTVRWSHRLDLDAIPLAIYARLDMVHDTLDSGTNPGNLEKRDRYLLGAELSLDPLTIIGEYEILDQQLSPPWQAYRVRANYFKPLSDVTTIDIGGYYEMLDYQDALAFGLDPGEEFRESVGAFARFVSKLNRHLLVRIEANYDEIRGRDPTTLARVGPSVIWNYGQTELRVSGYHAIYEQSQTEGVTDFISVQFSRRF